MSPLRSKTSLRDSPVMSSGPMITGVMTMSDASGFTSDELREFADQWDWEKTDEYTSHDADEWYLTYRSSEGNVQIEIDSESQIDGNLVNNVIIQGEPVDVTGDYEKFARFCASAERKEVLFRVDDSKGIWARLKASVTHDTDDIPEEKTFEQLSDYADTVVARLLCQMASPNTSLQDIKEVVDAIEEAYENIED